MASIGENALHQLSLNLHPNEASGLLTVENDGLLKAHGWEFALWAVLAEGEIQEWIAIIGHRRGSVLEEGWEIDRLYAIPTGDDVKTEDAETITRYDGRVCTRSVRTSVARAVPYNLRGRSSPVSARPTSRT